jgi:hypothetical protein
MIWRLSSWARQSVFDADVTGSMSNRQVPA